jgi:hypothetical protein
MGWSISFPVDISFIWDGTTRAGIVSGIEVLAGQEYCYFDRGGGVLGFTTGYILESDPGVQLLTMPAPNYLFDGAQCLTTLLNTSFYTGQLHAAWRITKPNEVLTIKAGHPVASIIPMEPALINNSKIIFGQKEDFKLLHGVDYVKALTKYGEENKKTANWYREAVNENGDKIGIHEVKVFNFETEERWPDGKQ